MQHVKKEWKYSRLHNKNDDIDAIDSEASYYVALESPPPLQQEK